MIVGIDHGYYAIKTKHVSFPSGIIEYDYEPYTMQNVLQYQGKYYVCGTGRQTLVKNKTSNDNYYLLTLAAIAEEIKHRKAERKTEVILAVGLPLSSFGREKHGLREYLLRKEQPVRFLYESELYEIRIKDVKLFPQGYSALALHPEYLKNEPSVLLVDIGGWTVDLMRLDNAVPNAATCRSLELVMKDNPYWEGSPTAFVALINVDIQPHVITRKLNVLAGRLYTEHGIFFRSERDHEGRKLRFWKGNTENA